MSTEIVTRLKALKLHGMASNWPELVARCRHAALEPEQLVEQLLDAEGAERNVRSIAYQMSAARFPAHRDLAGFDFGASAVDEALLRKLHTTTFTEAAHNVVLIGGPGTGKTHLATRWGSRPYRDTAIGCASTRRWSWSTRWRPRRLRAGPGSELAANIRNEAEHHIPFGRDDVEIDYHVTNPMTVSGQTELLLVAAKKEVVSDYVQVVRDTGLTPHVVDVAAVASQNGFEVNYPLNPNETVVLVNIGASVTNLAIVENNIPKVVRDVFISGNSFQRASVDCHEAGAFSR